MLLRQAERGPARRRDLRACRTLKHLRCLYPGSMTNRNTAPATAGKYADLPDEFLVCLLRRQHHIDPLAEQRKYVRMRHRDGSAEDYIEYTGVCARCGTKRVQLKYRYGFPMLVWGTYEWPEGYKKTDGTTWDKVALQAEFMRRHPISPRVEIRDIK